MSKARILLVDDEAVPGVAEPSGNYMWYYAQALRDSDFELVEVIGPDEALRALSENGVPFDLIVLDLMMPPGETLAREDTAGGLRTGVVLVDRIRAIVPHAPVVVLTNAQNPQIHQGLRRKPSVKEVLAKPDCTPFELADRVAALLGV